MKEVLVTRGKVSPVRPAMEVSFLLSMPMEPILRATLRFTVRVYKPIRHFVFPNISGLNIRCVVTYGQSFRLHGRERGYNGLRAGTGGAAIFRKEELPIASPYLCLLRLCTTAPPPGGKPFTTVNGARRAVGRKWKIVLASGHCKETATSKALASSVLLAQ